MQVELNVTRRDIAQFNLSRLFRLRSNLSLFLLILAVVTLVEWTSAGKLGKDINWFLVAVASAGGFVAAFLFCLAFVLLNSNARSGVLGSHTYIVEEAGLREKTQANDTLVYWSAIQKIEKGNFAITVQINAWLFHILPRRSFDRHEHFDAFYAALNQSFERGAQHG